MDEENIVITLYHTQYDKQRIKDKKAEYITLDPCQNFNFRYKKFSEINFKFKCQ